jgi:hypothetical protein
MHKDRAKKSRTRCRHELSSPASEAMRVIDAPRAAISRPVLDVSSFSMQKED